VQFLIDSAAGDFRAHHTPEPAKFRHVRVGHTTSNGATRYIMCGEFLPVVKEGKAEWMAFATVKTDPYEQYIGSQSGSFCQKPAFVQDSKADLAPQLQSKYDSLK
jgi:hypothetical protein